MSLIIINQQQKIQINQQWEDKLGKITELALVEENVRSNGEVSLVFMDDNGIGELNKTYRNKNISTDVLSFPMYESGEDVEDEEEILLGDIVISLEAAQRQAGEYSHSLEREICYLFVHGLFHLLGYDHLTPNEKEEMRKKEEKILAKFHLLR